MLFIFHIVQFFFMTVQSIKFNGSCPVIAEDRFDCNDNIGHSKLFFLMGHLPIDNNSLNMFYNPFNRLNCLSFTIRCQFGNSFSLEISCDVPDDLDAVEFCAMPLISLRTKTNPNSSIDFNFVINDDEICPRVLENVKVVKAKTEYLILYGCTNYGSEHEEGALILGSKNNVTESLKHFEEAFSWLKNSSAKIEDYKIYNASSLGGNLTGFDCGCNVEQPDPCEFFTQCKINGGNDYYYYIYEDYEAE